MKLKNLNAIITGANQGFGLEIAKKYVEEGASVAICARDTAKLEKVASELQSKAGVDQKVFFKKCDVSDENQVKSFVEDSIKEFGKIDILVNNAGIYGPKGCIEDVDTAEWKKAIEINLFGVFHFCKYVIPHMKKNNYGKIVNLSGGGATSPLPRISAYAASKAGVVRLIETLAEECRGYNIDINAIAPGALNTRLLDEVLTAGPEAVGDAFYQKAMKQKENGGAPLDKGADLSVYLASSQSNGITGKLISAIWDPWAELEKFKNELESDIYTLRRIIPEDRNKNWS